MPVYNASAYLHDAIESILQQSYPHFEFIIINDCSTDSSEEVIRSFHDQRIIYIKQPVNAGVVVAMNVGLGCAMGKYIAVMHADDISLPERLEMQVNAMEADPSIAVLAGKSIFVNEHNEPTSTKWKLDEATVTPAAIRKAMVKESCISHPTTMMRTDVVLQYGYQSSPLHQGFAVEDYPLWLQLLSDGYTIAKLDKTVLRYRVHTLSATGTYLRKKNPFLVNYYSKQFYLQQRKAKGKFNSFDKAVQRSMMIDFAKAQLKEIKKKLVGK